MALRKVQVRRAVMLGLFGCLAGCRSAPPPTFAQIWRAPEPYIARSGSGNAFDGYVLAAEKALADDPSGAMRVFFTPGQRRTSIKNLSGAWAEFRKAVRQPCTFEFRALPPFQEAKSHAGWRHLARALVWKLETAIETNATGDIETLTAQGFKFATDLTLGGAPEADLGLSLMNDIRKVLAPNLGRWNPALLGSLGTTVERTALERDWLEAPLKNERETMLAGVQFVQDAYVSGNTKELQAQLGSEVREALEYFKQLRNMSGDRQTGYFSGFAQEIDIELNHVRAQAQLPVQARKPLEFPEGTQRPWRRFAKHFFRNLRPLLDKQADTLARTRLFVLTCRILAEVKASGRAPATLESFGKPLITDPFTGRVFGYEADGPVFKVYSAGPDFIDNGGRTGDEFTSPDLTIEARP